MCGPPANTTGPWAFRDVGWIHALTIKGLKGDSAYKYLNLNPLISQPFSFAVQNNILLNFQ
jgi:hypothetical protein